MFEKLVGKRFESLEELERSMEEICGVSVHCIESESENKGPQVFICSFAYKPAFIPAIKPCPAASSYPLVPFICPALKSPATRFVSNDGYNCVGST